MGRSGYIDMLEVPYKFEASCGFSGEMSSSAESERNFLMDK